MDNNLSNAKYADRIITHYMLMALRNSGAHVDGDTESELSEIIENAVGEAVRVAVQEAVAECKRYTDAACAKMAGEIMIQ